MIWLIHSKEKSKLNLNHKTLARSFRLFVSLIKETEKILHNDFEYFNVWFG